MIALTATAGDAFTTGTPNANFVTLLSIGARPGEIDALRWAQVAVENRTITIDRAISVPMAAAR